jgi:hypothetical protein
MRLTTKSVTAAIRAAGINGELIRGNGYYVIAGADLSQPVRVDATSIANHSSREWVALAKTAIEIQRRDIMELMLPPIEKLITNSNLLPDDGSPLTEEDVIFVVQDNTAVIEHRVAAQVTADPTGIRAEHAAIEASQQRATATLELPQPHRLKFYGIDDGAALQDAMDALTSIGCVLGDVNTWDVSFSAERATIQFTTTLSLKEVKSLLAHTGVTL